MTGIALFVSLGLFLVLQAANSLLTYIPPRPLPGPETSELEQRRPIWNPPPEEPLPETGHSVLRFERSTAESTLRVRPRSEQGHLVVKVERSDNDQLVCWLFIRQGESAETPIPAGSYRLKLACGRRWYGETNLFGPGASYSAIVNEISIPARTAYTVDLHPSTTGTLRDRPLRANDF